MTAFFDSQPDLVPDASAASRYVADFPQAEPFIDVSGDLPVVTKDLS
jgi:hypothetical protein